MITKLRVGTILILAACFALSCACCLATYTAFCVFYLRSYTQTFGPWGAFVWASLNEISLAAFWGLVVVVALVSLRSRLAGASPKNAALSGASAGALVALFFSILHWTLVPRVTTWIFLGGSVSACAAFLVLRWRSWEALRRP